MKRIFILSLLIGLSALSWRAEAAKVKTWHHHRPADQEHAKRQGVVQKESGTLTLSRRLKSLARLDCTHVWSVVEDKVGNLYAATGDEGKVFKVTPAGKASVVYESDAAQVLSLAVDAKGESVYAGTGPTGRVVRIYKNAVKVVCEWPDTYVWAIALDPKSDAVYAATGPNGRIYKVTPDGKSSVFFDTKQDHVLCLAVADDGTVYAGTDKTGRVYRIDPRGKGFVLHQVAQAEVRTLLLTDTALYAGTSGTKKRPSRGGSGSSSSSTAKRIEQGDTVRVSTEKGEKSEKGEKVAAPVKKEDAGKEEKKGASSSAPSQPGSGDNSVYRIALDGGVREVFRDKVLVMSLARRGKRILVGTGMNAQLFEIDHTTRDRCEIAQLDHGQITALLPRKDGTLVVATGDPGQLYVLEDRHQTTGTLTSDVLDAKLVAKWGALRWRADVPANTRVSVATRSGNVSEVDDTWSDWSDEETDADEAQITAPAARYLQYRVTLTTDDPAASPSLKSLTLRYATTNQAPELTKLEVPDPSATSENPKKVKFKWSATDSNEDELRYRLYVKKDGWTDWIELEDDHEKTDYEWDTTTTPSGVYRLKVVASDHTDNPKAQALTAQRVSEPFIVCHDAPTVNLTATPGEGRKMGVEAKASSPLVRLTAASFTINGKRWQNVFPSDGLFDSKTEAFTFSTGELKPGTYVLVMKVQDAAGNTGSSDVVFTIPRPSEVRRK